MTERNAARRDRVMLERVANAGREPSLAVERVLAGSGNFGYNAATDAYGDMVAMGVIDPTKVTGSACRMPRRSRA